MISKCWLASRSCKVSPMQNIGAYGVEAKDAIESVTFWYWNEKRLLTYNNRECEFGYRDSIFKEALKGKGGFPLRVISHDAKGKETFKMEATKIEPGPLPDSLFVPPASYKRFDMPNMGSLFNRG